MGGELNKEAQLPAHISKEKHGISVANYCTELKSFQNVAHCINARDSKGYGRQPMTAVIVRKEKK